MKAEFFSMERHSFQEGQSSIKTLGKGGDPPLDWLYPYRDGANAIPGRLSAFMGNVPQFEDFQCRVNQVAYDCQFLQCRPKDFELPVQDQSEVRLHDLSVGLLQRSQSGVRRKVGNVPMISVLGLDQKRAINPMNWTSGLHWITDVQRRSAKLHYSSTKQPHPPHP
jgi:hypothetical protein